MQDGHLHIKGMAENPEAEAVVARIPAFMSQMYKVRGRNEYGKALHTFFSTIHAQLTRDPPCRTELCRLLKDVYAGSVTPVGSTCAFGS